MSKRTYNPLPQFSESDSDVDIFNAKNNSSQPKPFRHRAYYCNRRICFIFVIIALIVATIATIAFAISHKNIIKYSEVININSGAIVGLKESVTIKNQVKTAHKFKGIPFAEPPIGKRRWTPPVPKGNWSGTYKADQSGIKCMQFLGAPISKSERQPSEDCLYLDVFTPTLTPSKKLPVFVWLHGGYSMNGYADMYGYSADSEFVLSMDVVAVNVNFRLNAFGYLTLSELWIENEAYGNYGVMDQILALEWIKENIVKFGGDPTSVTVVGQSSGGTSIYVLLASPKADGLFHKAISMSGSSNFPANYNETASSNRIFLNKTKCKNELDINIKDCLYSLSPSEVLDSIPIKVYPFWGMEDLLGFPEYGRTDGAVFVIDPVILPKPPKDVAMLSSLKNNVSVLIGNTAQEPGIGPAEHFNNLTVFKDYLQKKLTKFNVSIEEVLNSYGNNITSVQLFYETIVTDVRETCPSNILAREFRKSPRLKNLYRYVVTYRPSAPIEVSNMSMHNAFHGIDAFSLFGLKLFKTHKITVSDQTFINTIRKTVKTFMTHGTIDGAKPGETIVFSGDGSLMVQHEDYHNKACEVWDKKQFIPYVWIN